jgi:hypothetical protein
MKKPRTQWDVGAAGVKGLFERWSILGALDGDTKRLATRLRAGEVSRAEMAFAADLIDGKVKPRRRRSNQPSRIENELIAEFVFHLQAIRPDLSRKEVIGKIAAMFGLKGKYDRHVYNVLQGLDPERRKPIGAVAFDRTMWNDEELMRIMREFARQ